MADPNKLISTLAKFDYDKVTKQQYKKVKTYYDKLDTHDPNKYRAVAMVSGHCIQFITAWLLAVESRFDMDVLAKELANVEDDD